VVLAEMMDIDAGHISLASPLGRALADGRVGDEVRLRLPMATRRLRIVELVTVHQAMGNGNGRRTGVKGEEEGKRALDQPPFTLHPSPSGDHDFLPSSFSSSATGS
jgi:hypothetical protein